MVKTALQILSFSLGVAGFAAGFFPKRTSKERIRYAILIAGLVAFVSSASALMWESYQRAQHIQDVCEQVVEILGKDAKSIDQLHASLAYEDLSTVSDAVASLVAAKRVGHRVVAVQDATKLEYRVRLFYVK